MSNNNSSCLVFISHAGPDKLFSRDILKELRERGIGAYMDMEELRPGDIGEEIMNQALTTATIGLFLLSPDFVAREWPMKELWTFLERSRVARAQGYVGPVLIPVFYRLTVAEMKDEGLFKVHAELFAKSGFFDASRQARRSTSQVLNALEELTAYTGIENIEYDTNDEEDAVGRQRLVQRIVSGIEQVVDSMGRQQDAQSSTPDPRIVKAALAQGKDKLDTVRLMVLGASTRGKTSTIASLRGEVFDDDRDSTRGIDLCDYYLVVGRKHVDDRVSDYLKRKDKFQAKFRLFYAKNMLDVESIVEAGPSSTVEAQGVYALPAGTENELTHESVVQQTDDAVHTPEDHSFNLEGLTLRCWDFGGQREYEVAHEMFISPQSILMLVFDLSRFEDLSTRDEEVRELSHWLQTVFALTPEESMQTLAESLVIVGTRRDSCQHPESIQEYIEVLRGSCMDTLDGKVSRMLKLEDVRILAIENRTAVADPQASGLADLETHLDEFARKIIDKSPEVPLRWLAFLESLREDAHLGGIFLTGSEIQTEMNGFYFPLAEADRTDELKALCLYFRDLGDLVLFDISKLGLPAVGEEFVVFLYPEKVLRALKVIVAPKPIRCRGLVDNEDRERMRKGLLTKQMLKKKWEKLDGLAIEEYREMLVELLTSLDLFVKLDSDLLGVPALLPFGWDDWGWLNPVAGRFEIAAITVFKSYVPFGLISRLISRLHRTVGAERTTVQYVRSNAVLLCVGIRGENSQVSQTFLGFDKARRELHWKVRSEKYEFRILGRCLKEFEEHMLERVNENLQDYEHYFVTDCPRGCSDMKFRLMFPIPSIERDVKIAPDELSEDGGGKWWDRDRLLSLEDVSKLCGKALCANENCQNYYSFLEAMKASEPSEKPGMFRKGVPDRYLAFVSHEGQYDKPWAVYLTDALERRGLRTFVDRRELKGSYKTADQVMNDAMNSAPVGVFIISPEFFGKEWTMRELRAFLARNASGDDSGERVVIFPIFHRLSYHDASDSALYENPKHDLTFLRLKFFDANRQQECSTNDAIVAIKKLCRFSGLEKKLPEMHGVSLGRNWISYRLLQLWRSVRGTVTAPFSVEDVDGDLRGVTLAEFFDFAAERIASAYEESKRTAVTAATY